MPKKTKYPNVSSGGILVKAINQLRKQFPPTIDINTLKKLSIAPGNESRIVAILKFLGFLNEEGKKTEAAKKVFSQSDDDAFSEGLEAVIKDAYASLFDLHGEDSWRLDRDRLVAFFRIEDDTGDLTGARQAVTFETLSALAGRSDIPVAGATRKEGNTIRKGGAEKREGTVKSIRQTKTNKPAPKATGLNENIGLTVRIEINLPSQGDRETYDAIFQSIRENLLDG